MRTRRLAQRQRPRGGEVQLYFRAMPWNMTDSIQEKVLQDFNNLEDLLFLSLLYLNKLIIYREGGGRGSSALP